MKTKELLMDLHRPLWLSKWDINNLFNTSQNWPLWDRSPIWIEGWWLDYLPVSCQWSGFDFYQEAHVAIKNNMGLVNAGKNLMRTWFSGPATLNYNWKSVTGPEKWCIFDNKSFVTKNFKVWLMGEYLNKWKIQCFILRKCFFFFFSIQSVILRKIFAFIVLFWGFLKRIGPTLY